MGFRGMTVAGAIATGAHGSSPKHPTVISSLVESVSLVLPNGNLTEISNEKYPPPFLKALRANLGMLGIVVQIRLSVKPQFNLKVQVTQGPQDSLMKKDGLWQQVSSCDYGMINWFPNSGRFIKTCGIETPNPVDRNASNVLLRPSIPSGLLQPYKLALHYGACSKTVSSLLEKVRYVLMKLQPPFQKLDQNGKYKTTSNLTGYSHRLMSSVLTAKHQGFFQTDWEFALPLSQAQPALREMADMIKKRSASFPLIGVFLRFSSSEDRTLLAHSTVGEFFPAGEPIVFVEFPTPYPAGLPNELRDEYEKPYTELARLLIEKFHARGHWGKNRNWVFQLQNTLGVYGQNLKEFQGVAKELDPTGMFQNDFSKNAGISN
jgi:FAD/FMN-containing dehydrogenase